MLELGSGSKASLAWDRPGLAGWVGSLGYGTVWGRVYGRARVRLKWFVYEMTKCTVFNPIVIKGKKTSF